MTDLQRSDVFLVGSLAVPSDTIEEALQVGAEVLGERLCALPDGEVGLRSWWIGGLGQLTFSKHPQIEEIEGGTPQPLGWFGSYRIKDGETGVSLEGYLPYADAAISSYAAFKELKAAGKLPVDLRFQVAVPTPHAAIESYFADPAEWSEMNEAWQRAVTADFSRILEVIPASELLIQWDYCTEVIDVVGADHGGRELEIMQPWISADSVEEKFARHTASEYIGPLATGIPDEVHYGYHVCLGTFPQFPTTPAADLGWMVRMTNALVRHTPRRVDFVHLPATAEADRAYFAPLTELDVAGARVFLGIGHRDGTDAITARGQAAREFLPDFGISHYCGYGRDDRDRITELLGELRSAADLLAAGTD